MMPQPANLAKTIQLYPIFKQPLAKLSALMAITPSRVVIYVNPVVSGA